MQIILKTCKKELGSSRSEKDGVKSIREPIKGNSKNLNSSDVGPCESITYADYFLKARGF